MNIYPDPVLTSPDYSASGSVSHSSGRIEFDGAGSSDLIVATSLSGLSVETLERIARAGRYMVSVNVDGYSEGDLTARLRNGANIPLGIGGNGWSAPVEVPAGELARGLMLRGYGSATLAITGISITT